jgi:hypothetical protein
LVTRPGFAPQYYPYGPYYGYAPPFVSPYAEDARVALCAQTYSTYDIWSRSYTDENGLRHLCP